MARAVQTKQSATNSDASPAVPPNPLSAGGSGNRFTRLITFHRMEVVSLCHSVVYLALLVCAFILDNPQPWNFILGLTHGLIWIGMSILSFFAVHYRVINLRLALAIALLGCVAPFFGSIEFLRQNRQRKQAEEAAA